MSLEYWLVDAESGNAQGCYLTLDEALRAAEFEAESQPVQSLRLLGMTSDEPTLQNEGDSETSPRLFVRFNIGLTQPLTECVDAG